MSEMLKWWTQKKFGKDYKPTEDELESLKIEVNWIKELLKRC